MGPEEEAAPIVSVEFEVFGHVQGKHTRKVISDDALAQVGSQVNKPANNELGFGPGLTAIDPSSDGTNVCEGVYFTKYCRDMALYLELGGWVKNSRRGTIVGKIQGTKPKVEQMVSWLSRTGSPGCKIERCELRDFEYLARQDFRGFSIRF